MNSITLLRLAALLALLFPTACATTGTIGQSTADEIELKHRCHTIHIAVVDYLGRPVSEGQVAWNIHGTPITTWQDLGADGTHTFKSVPGTNTSSTAKYHSKKYGYITSADLHRIDNDKNVRIQLPSCL